MNGSYDPVREQLRDSYKREGKVLTVLSTGNKNEVIFRRSQNKNTPKNHTTIFYFRDNTEIKQGSLILFQDKYFLVMNQEEIENDNYYRSDMVQCNGVLSALINKTQDDLTWYANELVMPVFADNMLSVALNSSSVITTLGGSISVITEDNEMSRLVQSGDEFDQWGGHWKIINELWMNGLAYFWLERYEDNTLASNTYKLEAIPTGEISSGNSYDYTDIFQPIVSQDAGGSTFVDYVIRNANLDIQSSDETIAVVDRSNRKINFLAEGNVELSCYWVEHGLSITIALTVNEYVVPSGYAVAVVDYVTPTVRQGSRRRLHCNFYAADGTDITTLVTINYNVTNNQGLAVNEYMTDDFISLMPSKNEIGYWIDPVNIGYIMVGCGEEVSYEDNYIYVQFVVDDPTYGHIETTAQVEIIDFF
jgi:hypothetical protein